MMIDASEAEVLEWVFAQSFNHTLARACWIELTARNLIEKILEFLV